MRTRSSKGWGRLPREIARTLSRVNLTKNEGKVLWAIIYKTIAFNKLEDRIPGNQIIALTGIEKRHMYRAVNGLLKKGIIFKSRSVYGIQRDFSKWEKVPILAYTNKKVPILGKKVPILGKKVPILEPSRDLSKRAIQEKGLSTSEREEKRKADKKGLAMIKEAIKRDPDRKRKNH